MAADAYHLRASDGRIRWQKQWAYVLLLADFIKLNLCQSVRTARALSIPRRGAPKLFHGA